MASADDLREKAFAMFAEGKKVNQVANALFNKNWAKAKKVHAEWKSENGGGRTALDLAKSGEEMEACDEWDLAIRVPTAKLNEIFGTFSTQEKVNAIQGVLQVRIDAALGIEAS